VDLAQAGVTTTISGSTLGNGQSELGGSALRSACRLGDHLVAGAHVPPASRSRRRWCTRSTFSGLAAGGCAPTTAQAAHFLHQALRSVMIQWAADELRRQVCRVAQVIV